MNNTDDNTGNNLNENVVPIYRLDTRLDSVENSLRNLQHMLKDTIKMISPGFDGNNYIINESMTKDQLAIVTLHLNYVDFMLGITRRQYHNEQLALFNYQIKDGFHAPLLPINMAKEVVRFGINNGVWKLGDGVMI